MTKSMTGLLTDILVAEGKLDDNALVSSIVPEFADKLQRLELLAVHLVLLCSRRGGTNTGR